MQIYGDFDCWRLTGILAKWHFSQNFPFWHHNVDVTFFHARSIGIHSKFKMDLKFGFLDLENTEMGIIILVFHPTVQGTYSKPAKSPKTNHLIVFNFFTSNDV